MRIRWRTIQWRAQGRMQAALKKIQQAKKVHQLPHLWNCCSFPRPGRHRRCQQALLGPFACHCRTWCALGWTAGNLHHWELLSQWWAALAAWGSHNSYLGNKKDISMQERGTRTRGEKNKPRRTEKKPGIKTSSGFMKPRNRAIGKAGPQRQHKLWE